MKQSIDYLAEVKRIYYTPTPSRLLLESHHTVEAAIVVERLFPPQTPHATFCILVSLNLLNAAVKLPWGKRLITYDYIKGMAAHLFFHLHYQPQEHVQTYHDPKERITYFRVFGVQISFHYLPHAKAMNNLQCLSAAEVQEWDGIRLQEISLELFRLAMPQPLEYSDTEAWNVRKQLLQFDSRQICQSLPQSPCPNRPAIQMRHRMAISQVFREDKLTSLHDALTFNIWNSHCFTLFRRKDQHLSHFMRYNGENYFKLLQYTIGNHPKIYRRLENSLEKDKFYHISPQMRLCALPLSNYIFTLTQNCYLVNNGNYSNLCITYGIALYLASRYPELLFVNTLEYNRRRNERRYYTYEHLLTVPLGSDERRMKVWIIVDTTYTLRHFRGSTLPRPLIEEYLAAEDFYMEFQFIRSNGLLGIIAYRRHILLPPLYPRITIHNYHAHVMSHDGKWAIFSLAMETFLSDFIYDNIWYDPQKYIIYGSINGLPTTIYEFFPTKKKKPAEK